MSTAGRRDHAPFVPVTIRTDRAGRAACRRRRFSPRPARPRAWSGTTSRSSAWRRAASPTRSLAEAADL